MAFTAADVKKLREMTNVGMMDCKKALTEADGDFDKAIEILREKGLAKAAKKADRIAAEGVVCATVCDDCGVGAIIEVNSETDFVAKNADFQQFVSDLAGVVMKEAPADVEALKTCKMGDLTVQEVLQEKVLTIGENIQIRRFDRFDDSTVNVAYTHMGGVIGVLVGLQVSDNLKDNATVKELGKDIGMQAAAMNPSFLDKSDVDEATLAKEKEILLVRRSRRTRPLPSRSRSRSSTRWSRAVSASTTRRTASCSRLSLRRTRSPLSSTSQRLPRSWAARSSWLSACALRRAKASRRSRTTSQQKLLPWRSKICCNS